jgi:hypothetical protein
LKRSRATTAQKVKRREEEKYEVKGNPTPQSACHIPGFSPCHAFRFFLFVAFFLLAWPIRCGEASGKCMHEFDFPHASSRSQVQPGGRHCRKGHKVFAENSGMGKEINNLSLERQASSSFETCEISVIASRQSYSLKAKALLIHPVDTYVGHTILPQSNSFLPPKKGTGRTEITSRCTDTQALVLRDGQMSRNIPHIRIEVAAVNELRRNILLLFSRSLENTDRILLFGLLLPLRRPLEVLEIDL